MHLKIQNRHSIEEPCASQGWLSEATGSDLLSFPESTGVEESALLSVKTEDIKGFNRTMCFAFKAHRKTDIC